jgi:hypothetical protein
LRSLVEQVVSILKAAQTLLMVSHLAVVVLDMEADHQLVARQRLAR